MKDNSKLISTLFREANDSNYKQYFRDNKKTPEPSMADHKVDKIHEKQIQ